VPELDVINPKQNQLGNTGRENGEKLFPYYAGYSSSFATTLLESATLPKGALVVDPWNGGGTTTAAAIAAGLDTVGYDANPVMVVVAKSLLIDPEDLSSLLPLGHAILKQARTRNEALVDDPLMAWITPASAAYIRRIEREINSTLVKFGEYLPLDDSDSLGVISPLAAFFYTVLFKVVRRLCAEFIPSNPTWVKHPKSTSNRKRPSLEGIEELYLAEVVSSVQVLTQRDHSKANSKNDARILLGNAERIQLKNSCVDAIVTSPPYCTRIDYAVATSLELAILQFDSAKFDRLRRSLMGTSTVPKASDEPNENLGSTCLNFLEKVYAHPSKASKTYYFKNHLQYFLSLQQSISEISRVLKKDGICAIVVQDSYYKDIYNDVPSIVAEMAMMSKLDLLKKVDFSVSRSMVGLNKKARAYTASRENIESVICLIKN